MIWKKNYISSNLKTPAFSLLRTSISHRSPSSQQLSQMSIRWEFYTCSKKAQYVFAQYLWERTAEMGSTLSSSLNSCKVNFSVWSNGDAGRIPWPPLWLVVDASELFALMLMSQFLLQKIILLFIFYLFLIMYLIIFYDAITSTYI